MQNSSDVFISCLIAYSDSSHRADSDTEGEGFKECRVFIKREGTLPKHDLLLYLLRKRLNQAILESVKPGIFLDSLDGYFNLFESSLEYYRFALTSIDRWEC